MAGIDAAHLLAAFAFGLDVTLYALDTVLIYNTLMTAAWMMSPLAIAVSAGLILYMTCRAVEMTAAYEEYLEGGSEELDEIFADAGMILRSLVYEPTLQNKYDDVMYNTLLVT